MRYLPVLVFVLGFVIRLYACCFTFIINPDGVLYIHQARALYYGQWDMVTSCGLSDLSMYPMLIAGAFSLFGDWVLAAQSVSLVFGTAVLFPVYFTVKRFFDKNISATATLIFALIPVMVGRSADVLRDPVGWFFLALAICWFVTYMDRKNSRFLLFSGICFILASWARIESILYAGVSFFAVLLVKQDRKLRHLMVFSLPFVCLAVVFSIGVTAHDVSVNDLHRAKLLVGKISQPFARYSQLRTELAQAAAGFQDDFVELFLPEARSNLWLVAFGTMINRMLEAFFYPFALVFGIGMTGIRRRVKTDHRLLYLSVLALSAAFLLYLHLLDTWMMYYRFVVILILPCAVFAGYGIEKIRNVIERKTRIGKTGVLAVIVLLILVSGLSKNLQYRRYDKKLFREIGEFIAEKETNDQVIKIAASYHRHRWISFYSNVFFEGSPCPDPDMDNDWEKHLEELNEYIIHLRDNNIRYFLWEERYGPLEQFCLSASALSDTLSEMARWTHRDTGEMILYKVL